MRLTQDPLRQEGTVKASNGEKFECLDCGRVTIRSKGETFQCPVCGSLEGILANSCRGDAEIN